MPTDAVGIRLEGYPQNEEKFYWILAQESCHPKATKRILERIKLNGFDLLTITVRVNVEWVREALKEVGVQMTYIPPLDNWKDNYNDGAWDEELIQKVLSERDRKR